MQQQVAETFKKYESQGTEPWTFETAAQDLQYQIGSIAKCVLQLKNKRFVEGLSEEEIKRVLSDELADVIADVLFIADDLGIDIEQAWEGMLRSDDKKIKERT